MFLNHCSIHCFSIKSPSIRYNGIMVLILWQYLKMASFSESKMALLIVNENCLQYSLALGNCQEGYYADVDSSAFELL